MKVLPQVTVQYVRLLYNFWINHGVPRQILDRVLKVNIEEDDLIDFSLSSDQLFQLHNAAIAHTQDLSLGIKLGLYLAEKNLVISNFILTAPTLQDSVQGLVEYSSLVAESGYFKCVSMSDDSQSANDCALYFIAHPDIAISSHQFSMVFAVVITWFKKILQNDQPEIIYYSNATSVNESYDSDLLGCRVKTSEDNFLTIPANLLASINPLYHSKKHQQEFKKVKKLRTKRQESLVWYEKVQLAVQNCMDDPKCTTNQECVAASLNLSVRNMQRKLKRMGVNYQAILDDHRKILAMQLLQENTVTLSEISYLVGFTEPSAFYKAFRRWTGKRPGQYRPDTDC